MSEPETTPAKVDGFAETCFLVLCRDDPAKADLRQETRPDHLNYAARHWRRYLAAGPLRDEPGGAIVGSMFLVLAKNEEEARAFMNGDPYMTAGIYARVTYQVFTPAIGRALGGKIW